MPASYDMLQNSVEVTAKHFILEQVRKGFDLQPVGFFPAPLVHSTRSHASGIRPPGPSASTVDETNPHDSADASRSCPDTDPARPVPEKRPVAEILPRAAATSLAAATPDCSLVHSPESALAQPSPSLKSMSSSACCVQVQDGRSFKIHLYASGVRSVCGTLQVNTPFEPREGMVFKSFSNELDLVQHVVFLCEQCYRP